MASRLLGGALVALVVCAAVPFGAFAQAPKVIGGDNAGAPR